MDYEAKPQKRNAKLKTNVPSKHDSICVTCFAERCKLQSLNACNKSTMAY